MARQTTASFTSALSRSLRSALPEVPIESPERKRGRRDRAVDAAMYLIAFAIAAVAVGDTWMQHAGWLRAAEVVTGIAAVAALHWRRSHPATVGLFTAGISIVVIAASGAQLVAAFNAAVRARAVDLAWVAGVSIVSCFSIPLIYADGNGYLASVGIGLLCTGIVIGWGLFVRARRELGRSRREQAERAEAEVRAAERRRIAREMHDVLAHRISLLSVHAGALEYRPDAPAAEVSEAAGVIRASARAALEELRSVIGVLREEEGEGTLDPPQPELADLPALVEESRKAGMRLSARIDLDGATPPTAVGRTAYRIAQEGLTNARKHSPGAAVTLTVHAPDNGLEVEVRSGPVAVPVSSSLPGAGTGLIGLAERVTLAGGELERGIDPDGAFVLHARLPR